MVNATHLSFRQFGFLAFGVGSAVGEELTVGSAVVDGAVETVAEVEGEAVAATVSAIWLGLAAADAVVPEELWVAGALAAGAPLTGAPLGSRIGVGGAPTLAETEPDRPGAAAGVATLIAAPAINARVTNTPVVVAGRTMLRR